MKFILRVAGTSLGTVFIVLAVYETISSTGTMSTLSVMSSYAVGAAFTYYGLTGRSRLLKKKLTSVGKLRSHLKYE
ncbi:hypothetical protein GCM10025772_28180 [Ferrimonas gelatinilytica]|uniref:Uncharacterized protein n=1 Tax=Ferrimonas gelatinilytica TaxID=1255257 RepID=A0ABP9SH01_9GAMM